jgi:hypothetical protein
VKWKLLIFFAAGLTCAVSSAAQDLGSPDSVRIEPSTLYVGKSYPVYVAVVNDRLLKTINFGLITRTKDTGFARLDSITYVGRMNNNVVLNLRLSGFRETNGVSPDTSVISAFWAGTAGSKLGPGNTSVAAIFMTGTHLGSMTIDSGFLPPGGEFLVIPWDTNFTAVGFAPKYRTTTIRVRPAKYVCGNVDGDPDGYIDISDLSALIDYLYISFTIPPGFAMANVDDSPDHGIDISDLSALIAYLYLGGPLPICQAS